MSRTLRLFATASAVLDASGYGTAAAGPYFAAVPGAASPGAATPGDPGGPVSFAGTGTGIAAAGPQSPGEVWSGLTASVRVATNISEATCRIYAGASPAPGYLAAVTTWGSTGAGTQNIRPVRVGASVWATWSGGDPGATATLTITGIRTVA